MIHIPTTWDEISLSQYLELTKLNPDDYQSQIEFVIEKLAIVTNTSSDDEYWELMSYNELLRILESISFIQSSPPNKFKHQLLDKYYYIGFNEITLGGFIDLEYFLSDLSKFFPIVFRQKKQDDFGNDVYETYSSYNLDKRAELFSEIPITHLFGLINEYIKFRDEIFNQYQGLLAQSIEEDEEHLKKLIETNPELAAEIEADKKEEAKEKKWGWERLLFHLSGGDFTKIEDILNLKLIFVFNLLGMKRELNLD